MKNVSLKNMCIHIRFAHVYFTPDPCLFDHHISHVFIPEKKKTPHAGEEVNRINLEINGNLSLHTNVRRIVWEKKKFAVLF